MVRQTRPSPPSRKGPAPREWCGHQLPGRPGWGGSARMKCWGEGRIGMRLRIGMRDRVLGAGKDTIALRQRSRTAEGRGGYNRGDGGWARGAEARRPGNGSTGMPALAIPRMGAADTTQRGRGRQHVVGITVGHHDGRTTGGDNRRSGSTGRSQSGHWQRSTRRPAKTLESPAGRQLHRAQGMFRASAQLGSARTAKAELGAGQLPYSAGR